MIRISILNFIPYLTGKEKTIPKIENKSPEEASKIIRESCREKGKNFEEWERLIKEHCIIPKDEPFKKLLQEKGIPFENSLWTLGSIAYGTGDSAWIVIQNIKWDDGKISLPEKEHKDYIKTLDLATV